MHDATDAVTAEVRAEVEGSPLVAAVSLLGLAAWVSMLLLRLVRRLLASEPHQYAKARSAADMDDDLDGALAPEIPPGRVQVYSRYLEDDERYLARGGRSQAPPVLALTAPVDDDDAYDDYYEEETQQFGVDDEWENDMPQRRSMQRGAPKEYEDDEQQPVTSEQECRELVLRDALDQLEGGGAAGDPNSHAPAGPVVAPALPGRSGLYSKRGMPAEEAEESRQPPPRGPKKKGGKSSTGGGPRLNCEGGSRGPFRSRR